MINSTAILISLITTFDTAFAAISTTEGITLSCISIFTAALSMSGTLSTVGLFILIALTFVGSTLLTLIPTIMTISIFTTQ